MTLVARLFPNLRPEGHQPQLPVASAGELAGATCNRTLLLFPILLLLSSLPLTFLSPLQILENRRRDVARAGGGAPYDHVDEGGTGCNAR